MVRLLDREMQQVLDFCQRVVDMPPCVGTFGQRHCALQESAQSMKWWLEELRRRRPIHGAEVGGAGGGS